MSAQADYEDAMSRNLAPYLQMGADGEEECIVVGDGFEYVYTRQPTEGGLTMPDQADNVVPLHSPTTAPEPAKLTPAQQAAQDVIQAQDYATMLRDTVPTLKADHAGAVYLLAVLDQAGDAHVKRRQFLKAAGKVTGGHPPFMELALIQIQASKGAR